MALAAVATGLLIFGLVIVYLTKPHRRDLRLSSARFFQDAPASEEPQHRLRLENLVLSPPFYMQLAVLLLLLVGFLLSRARFTQESDFQGIGLWIVVDTSASMSTAQGRVDRMTLAQTEIEKVMNHLGKMEQQQVTCVAFLTFDQALTMQASNASIEQVSRAVTQIVPRALGTDLTLIRGLLRQLDDPGEGDCPATHILVVTDLPAPDWLDSTGRSTQIIWRDVAEPVDNVGILDIRRANTLLLSQEDRIEVDLAAYGRPEVSSGLEVASPDGTLLITETIDWTQPGSKQISFVPTVDGEYSIRLTAGEAYRYDDQATITVDRNERLRVDWQMDDRRLPELLGWQLDNVEPQLRVMPYPGQVSDVPTLLVGEQYGADTSPTEIFFFEETCCLLTDLNFDIAESLGLAGEEFTAGSPLRAVMSGGLPSEPASERVWFAVNEKPSAAYVPSLPTFTGNQNLDSFSVTAFFNGVRCLLQERQPSPLFTLTTPADPVPDGTRIALHPGEGNTTWAPLSHGEIEDIQPVPLSQIKEPVWPIVLAMALLIMSLERGLAFLGSSRWR